MVGKITGERPFGRGVKVRVAGKAIFRRVDEAVEIPEIVVPFLGRIRRGEKGFRGRGDDGSLVVRVPEVEEDPAGENGRERPFRTYEYERQEDGDAQDSENPDEGDVPDSMSVQ